MIQPNPKPYLQIQLKKLTSIDYELFACDFTDKSQEFVSNKVLKAQGIVQEDWQKTTVFDKIAKIWDKAGYEYLKNHRYNQTNIASSKFYSVNFVLEYVQNSLNNKQTKSEKAKAKYETTKIIEQKLQAEYIKKVTTNIDSFAQEIMELPDHKIFVLEINNVNFEQPITIKDTKFKLLETYKSVSFGDELLPKELKKTYKLIN